MPPKKKPVSTMKATNDKGQKRKVQDEDDDKDSGVSSMSPESTKENVEESDSDYTGQIIALFIHCNEAMKISKSLQ